MPGRGWVQGLPPPWAVWGWHFLPPPHLPLLPGRGRKGVGGGSPASCCWVQEAPCGHSGGSLCSSGILVSGGVPSLLKGPLGPPAQPFPTGGCSFCLHTTTTGNSPPQAAMPLSVTMRTFFILTLFTKCNFHGHTLVQGATRCADHSRLFHLCSTASVSVLQVFAFWSQFCGLKYFLCQERSVHHPFHAASWTEPCSPVRSVSGLPRASPLLGLGLSLSGSPCEFPASASFLRVPLIADGLEVGLVDIRGVRCWGLRPGEAQFLRGQIRRLAPLHPLRWGGLGVSWLPGLGLGL